MSDMHDLPVREAIRRINEKARLALFPEPSGNSPASISHVRAMAGAKGLAATKRGRTALRQCPVCLQMHDNRSSSRNPLLTCSPGCTTEQRSRQAVKSNARRRA